MRRKIFISFLGTGTYVRCPYEAGGNKSSIVRFVQEAYLEMFCMDWNENDQIFILLTNEALSSNWDGKNYHSKAHHPEFKTDKDEGLRNRLKLLREKGLKANIQYIDKIPTGKDTSEIWNIFNILKNLIQEEDEIHFDITHGFRSLPMLGMVFLNYIKVIKNNIQIQSISYGAYENLAGIHNIPTFKIKDIPLSEREAAPILNLISFSELQDWSNAANTFVKYGNSKALTELGNRGIKHLFRGANQKSELARKKNKFFKSLNDVTEDLQNNRGKNIVKAKNFKNLNLNLEAIKEENFIVPMQPILKKIQEKISYFNTEEDWKNGFKAVDWCIKHNMIQQGITMLQENIITYYCISLKLDYSLQDHRDLVNSMINIKVRKIENTPDEWKGVSENNKDYVLNHLSFFNKEIIDNFQSLTASARNDINHGGFSKNASPDSLKSRLQNSYNLIKNILLSP